jgi:serine protease
MTANRPRLLRLEDRVTPSTAIADRVLVTFSEVVPEAFRVATLTDADAGAFAPVGFGVYAIDLRAGDDSATEAVKLATLNGVLSATPDTVIPPDALAALVAQGAGDPAYASQTWLRAISAPAAWAVAPGTGRTIVAVIDSGVDATHPDVAPNLWTNPNEVPGNGVDDDGDGIVDDVHGANFLTNTGDVTDTLGHGTAVSGVLGAAADNGVAGRGVNPHVTLMPLKFLGPNGGRNSDAIRAIDFAVGHGARVVNASWGGGGYDPALASVIQRAGAAGVVFVTAAGNSATNIDATPFYPASYATTLDNVVAVAASSSTGTPSYYSNYGAGTVLLAAPSDNVVTTAPGGGTTVLSGTSLAAPMVSGALSLVWDQHPDWSARQVLAALRQSIDVLPGLVGKTATNGQLNVAKLVGAPAAAPPVTPPAPPPAVPPATPPAALPAVATAGFAGSRGGQFDRVSVTFTQAADPAAVAAGVSVTGPAGGVRLSAVIPVAGSGNTRFTLMFSKAQAAAGVYTLSVGGYTTTAPLGAAATPPASPVTPPPASTAPRVTYEAGTPRAVLDRRTTRVEIFIPDNFTAADVTVALDLDHGRPADLQVRLTAPDGRRATLVDRSSASLSQAAFRPISLYGASARGVWVLEIFDLAPGVSGTLWQASLSMAKG